MGFNGYKFFNSALNALPIGILTGPKNTPQFSHDYLISPKGKLELKNGPKIGDELKSLLIRKTSLKL